VAATITRFFAMLLEPSGKSRAALSMAAAAIYKRRNDNMETAP